MLEKFPIDAWWVRQGFDTALVLIDRVKSAAPLKTICKFASVPKYQAIRDLSMVSRDLFSCKNSYEYKIIPLNAYRTYENNESTTDHRSFSLREIKTCSTLYG